MSERGRGETRRMSRDREAEIRARWADTSATAVADIGWLLDECDRLRRERDRLAAVLRSIAAADRAVDDSGGASLWQALWQALRYHQKQARAALAELEPDDPTAGPA